ncbi:MAG: hypothetical protein IKN38_04530 [Clostridia bacterium]|nr:hypothetical protein [Clostridia bacterium]
MSDGSGAVRDKGAAIRKYTVLALSGYSVIICAVLFIFGKLLPSPLAEYMALTYTIGKGGRIFASIPFALLYAFYIALCVWVYLGRKDAGKIPRVIMAILLLIDTAIHAYVFLAASGYQWNYLASAALDMVIVVCVLYEALAKKAKGEGEI